MDGYAQCYSDKTNDVISPKRNKILSRKQVSYYRVRAGMFGFLQKVIQPIRCRIQENKSNSNRSGLFSFGS